MSSVQPAKHKHPRSINSLSMENGSMLNQARLLRRRSRTATRSQKLLKRTRPTSTRPLPPLSRV